jgi:hypothetical protein
VPKRQEKKHCWNARRLRVSDAIPFHRHPYSDIPAEQRHERIVQILSEVFSNWLKEADAGSNRSANMGENDECA